VQEKLDESIANGVRIETMNTQKSEQLVGLEREMEALQQQNNVRLSLLPRL